MRLKTFTQIRCFTCRHIDSLLLESARVLFTLSVDMETMLEDMHISRRSLRMKAMTLLESTREALDTVKAVVEFMKTTEVYWMTSLASHMCMIKLLEVNCLDFC
jgi:hypothetical protein